MKNDEDLFRRNARGASQVSDQGRVELALRIQASPRKYRELDESKLRALLRFEVLWIMLMEYLVTVLVRDPECFDQRRVDAVENRLPVGVRPATSYMNVDDGHCDPLLRVGSRAKTDATVDPRFALHSQALSRSSAKPSIELGSFSRVGGTMNNRTIGKRFRAMATAFVAVAGLFLFRDVGAQTCTPDFLITPTPNGPRYNRSRLKTAESRQALAGAAWLVMPRRVGRVTQSNATADRVKPAPTNSWPNPTYLSSTPAAEAATGDRPMKVNINKLMVRPI